MYSYDFFVLCVLLWLPGLAIVGLRRDLLGVGMRVIPFTLPFALTEPLFYRTYWSPTFFWNLGDRLGFGLEDFLFVSGLGVVCTTLYAALSGRRYTSRAATAAVVWRRIALLGLTTLLLLGILLAAGVSILFGAVACMMVAALWISVCRRDLAAPGVIGALAMSVLYWLLCVIFQWIYPGVFRDVWHTDGLSNVYPGGVPLEEWLYGLGCGWVGTLAYPYMTGASLPGRKAAGGKSCIG
jgi:hypothetical protein